MEEKLISSIIEGIVGYLFLGIFSYFWDLISKGSAFIKGRYMLQYMVYWPVYEWWDAIRKQQLKGRNRPNGLDKP